MIKSSNIFSYVLFYMNFLFPPLTCLTLCYNEQDKETYRGLWWGRGSAALKDWFLSQLIGYRVASLMGNDVFAKVTEKGDKAIKGIITITTVNTDWLQ